MGEEHAAEKPVIRVRNLYKIYHLGENAVHALDGVDMEVYPGEFCAIIGPSGSGKSTLLNMLAGLEKPTRGEVVIAGKHIEKLSEDGLISFRRNHVGFIFQSYNLLGTMSAAENVALPLAFRGIPLKKRLKEAEKYLKLVGLGAVADHVPSQMSGGQQQRAGIARALIVKPEIVFADEPTGNLDSKTTMEVLALLKKIGKETGQTLVMVTHDPRLTKYADKVFHIVDGKIVNVEYNDPDSMPEEVIPVQGPEPVPPETRKSISEKTDGGESIS